MTVLRTRARVPGGPPGDTPGPMLANAEDALRFVRRHGMVLMAARGALPTLTHAIAGAPIRGSWWAHPRSHQIFRLLEAVCDSRQVLVCRLMQGKVTLVHRRLWPALVRLSRRLPRRGLDAIREEHTARGRHRVVITPFPRWVPAPVLERGRRLDEEKAASMIGPDVLLQKSGSGRRRGPKEASR